MILDQEWPLYYQLIRGKLPFGRGLGAAPAIVAAKLPAFPTLFATKPQFRPLTDDLWSIVSACLQKDSSKRPRFPFRNPCINWEPIGGSVGWSPKVSAQSRLRFAVR